MANSDPFVQKVLNDLSPLGDVSARPMFGGHGVFVGGRMFALIAKDVLFLKADDANRGEFEAAGMKPYGKMPYYQAPATAMQNPEHLVALGGGAVAASVRGDRKKSKGKKSRNP